MPGSPRLSPGRHLRLPSLRRGEVDGSVPLPPQRTRLAEETDQDFIALGDELVDLLSEHAGLCSDSRVLDIGCGDGPLPHALRRHGFAGTYLGIDVLKPQVRWCARRLGGDGFRFRHVDVADDRHNPAGKVAVADLDLGDSRFDVIAAFNLFTRMWPDDLLAYLQVMARSLAFEGRAAAHFFLLESDPDDLAETEARRMPFERQPGCRYESEDDPLQKVGYDLKWLVFKGAEVGLVPAGAPLYGTWARRPAGQVRHHPGYQDLLVFSRLEDALRRR